MTTKTYVYGATGAETMTVYSPHDRRRHPAILFVHGGGWQRDNSDAAELRLARDIQHRTGWVVAVANYPTDVSPRYSIEPDAIWAAVRYLRNHVSGTRRDAVSLWGESAGGNLALTVAYRYPWAVAGVVSISGPTEMAAEYDDQYARSNVEYYENEPPDQASSDGDDRYQSTSPLSFAQPGLPATFQAVGANDPLVPSQQIRDLGRTLKEYGDNHATHVVAGATDHSTTLEHEVANPRTGKTVEELAISYLRHVT